VTGGYNMPNIKLNELRLLEIDTDKYLVPNVLPNNFKDYREIRKATVRQLADELLIDRNFLTAVEANDKNFSGKTAVRYLKHYDINFYTVYDIQGKRKCDTIKDVFYSCEGMFSISLKDATELYFAKNKNAGSCNNDEVIKFIADKDPSIQNAIKGELLSKEEKYLLEQYKVKGTKLEEEVIHYTLEVMAKKEVEVKAFEFDVNFARDEDRELTNSLFRIGYKDTIATLEYDVDFDLVSVINNKVYFDKTYRIPIENNVEDFYEIKELDIKSREAGVEVKYDSEGNPTTVKFRAVRPEINNFKKYRILASKNIEQMHKAIGLSYNGYINLELGNQKISTKIMWRICKNLRVPLEAIVNIDEYFERFCQHQKIEKKASRKTK
jgi:DNA-binding XRE family transcriptional regulator